LVSRVAFLGHLPLCALDIACNTPDEALGDSRYLGLVELRSRGLPVSRLSSVRALAHPRAAAEHSICGLPTFQALVLVELFFLPEGVGVVG
jgi:hypothetical protein